MLLVQAPALEQAPLLEQVLEQTLEQELD